MLRTLRVEGGAKFSERFSGTGWGGVWDLPRWQRSALEKEGGRRGPKVEVVELDLKWLQRVWEQ